MEPRARTTLLILFFLMTVWNSVLADEVRLKVKAIPTDVTVWLDGKALPYDSKSGTFLLDDTNSEEIELEVRAPGHISQNIRISLPGDGPVVRIPADESRILYLEPNPVEVLFKTTPASNIYLQMGDDKLFLGRSGETVVVPPAGLSSQFVRVVFEAAGYDSVTVDIARDDLQAEWPQGDSLKLQAYLPVLSPVIYWLSSRRFLSLSLLVFLIIVALLVVRRLRSSAAS